MGILLLPAAHSNEKKKLLAALRLGVKTISIRLCHVCIICTAQSSFPNPLLRRRKPF
jgi:hypothetical protein